MNDTGKMFEKILLVRISSSVFQKMLHPKHYEPPYTLKYTEALLKNSGGYQVKLIDCMARGMTKEKLLLETLVWSPQMIVISIELLTIKDALAYATLVKKQKDIFITAIGKLVISGFEDELDFQNCFDVILPGEAEREAGSLIERLSQGKSSVEEESKRYALYRRGEGEPILQEDLDSLPFPQYTLAELQTYSFLYPLRTNRKVIWGHILSSRGCPENCIFCSPTTRVSYGKKLRSRSAVNVVDEMVYLINRGANVISFDDDNFTGSARHVGSICEEIQKRGLKVKWIVHARIDKMTGELMENMKNAGCILLRFGIESGSRRIIKLLGKTDSDIDWTEKGKEVFRDAKKIGIATAALFIVRNPTETRDEVEESIQLARELNPDVLQVHFFTPYPGSISYGQFSSQIEKKNVFKMHHYIPSEYNLSNIDENKLGHIQAYFYKRFLLNPKFIFCHAVRYGQFYLYNRTTFFRLLKIIKLPTCFHE